MRLASAPSAADTGAIDLANRPLETTRTVAHLKLNCPAPGRWDAEHVEDFVSAIRRRSEDPAVSAILLQGRRLFADESGKPSRLSPENLDLVYSAVADAKIPVIAFIAGQCSGTGLELAIACAARIAAPAARLEDLTSCGGRLPDPATLVRLCKLVDVERAGDLIVFGAAWDAREAASAGVVDAIAARNPEKQVERLSAGASLKSRPAPAKPDVVAAQLYVMRLRVRRDFPDREAPLMRLRALEYATHQPPKRALQDLDQLQGAYCSTPEAQALGYAARGEAALRRRSSVTDIARELRWSLLREAVHLVDEGASPAQVDRELTQFGFSEGPFSEADRRGLGKTFGRTGALASSEDWFTYSPTLDLMADAGRLGGDAPGWFCHGSDGHMWLEPEVEELLHASANFQRLQRRHLPDGLIVERCLYAAMNAAAHLLDAIPDLSAETLDAIWVKELGFPRWRGGPLFMARVNGEPVIKSLEAWVKQRNTAGAPSLTLRRLSGCA